MEAARAAKLRLRKSAPGAGRRDTVCAEGRSAFRKRLCGESVVGAKQEMQFKKLRKNIYSETAAESSRLPP